jgi:hypothetical protein
MLETPLRLSLSTWALHSALGTVAPGRPGQPDARLMTPGESTLDLLDVPRELAARGIFSMELCHFHVPDRSEAYLEKLKSALSEAGVELWSVLIDDGDLTHPEHGERDRAWILGWIDTASKLGATCARVIAGKQPPTDENLEKAVAQLKVLTMEAYVRGVRVLTENWFDTLSTPEAVGKVMVALDGSVGLNFDFGNWGGPEKYNNLAKIIRWAEGSHAKCDFVGGKPDAEDFTKTLEVTRAGGYSGPYSIVHGESNDLWGSIEAQKALIAPFLHLP